MTRQPLVPKPVRGVLLWIAAVAVVCGLFAGPHLPHAATLALPPVAFAVAVFLAESFPIHIVYRREATSFSLFEVPLIIGIVVLPGWSLLAAVAAGSATAFVLVRRQMLFKVVFNVINLVAHASITMLVFDLLRGSETGFGVPVVMAAFGAAATGSVVASWHIALAIRATEGVLDKIKTLDMLVFSAVVGVTNAALAMMALKLLEIEMWSVALLAVPLLVAAGAYRAFVGERVQREQFQFLFAATRALTNDPGRSDAISVLVRETADMFRATRVELVLFENADAVDISVQCSNVDDEVTVTHLDDRQVATLRGIVRSLGSSRNVETVTPHDDLGEWLLGLGIGTALVTPLRCDSGDIGLFVVADRIGAMAPFRDAELKLFSTLGLQVETALENDRLAQALDQLRELEGELTHLANHDLLTGLPNRLRLRNHLEQLVEDGGRADLLFLDLDDFKFVNDTLGHSSGDQLLVEVADRIRDCLNPDDFVARLGGDEFAVCVRGSDDGALVARRIVDAVGEPMTIDSTTVTVGCSIGIASCSSSSEVATILRRADVAMYAAKSQGKNRVVNYSDRLGNELLSRQRLRHEIRLAVEEGDMRVHYQPIFDLDDVSKGPIGAEALVRWLTPEGLRTAGSFLAAAEESGFIAEIDRLVFAQVVKDWPGLADLDWVSVNLSARHLQDDDLVDWLLRTAAEASVEPASLVLEITETATIRDLDATLGKLTRLREAGFGIALDDFGTGYSSIAYLRRLPISVLKIAQPFVTDLHAAGDSTFVRAMVDLSHTLGLPVVAEGVETFEQLTSLRTIGCDLAQGFLLGRAMPVDDLAAGRSMLLGDDEFTISA